MAGKHYMQSTQTHCSPRPEVHPGNWTVQNVLCWQVMVGCMGGKLKRLKGKSWKALAKARLKQLLGRGEWALRRIVLLNVSPTLPVLITSLSLLGNHQHTFYFLPVEWLFQRGRNRECRGVMRTEAGCWTLTFLGFTGYFFSLVLCPPNY